MSESPVEEDEPPCPRARPLIYVASLADYDNGRIHGVWIYADAHRCCIEVAIASMLAASPEPHAEDWAIHDYEGFEPFHLAEDTSLSTVVELVRSLEARPDLPRGGTDTKTAGCRRVSSDGCPGGARGSVRRSGCG